MKILVVDDDPAILNLCATALRASGHQVVTCDSGGPALEAALRQSFDLALCDLNLPDVHGLEVVRAIKMQAPALAVIVMSALDPNEWASASSEAGAAHFLSKPLRLETLRHEVSMVEASRSGLAVVAVFADIHELRQVSEHFESGGGAVRRAKDAADALVFISEDVPDLVIVDGGVADSGVVITVCGRRGIPCFVVADDAFDDDAALRSGASLVMRRPLRLEQLLLQAHFLTGR